MSSTVKRTPKSGRQSLFYQDLASPITGRRSGTKFSTPGQAAAVSALWKENFATSDLPPPPVFTLEDRSDCSPESGIQDYPISPEMRSDNRSPFHSSGKDWSTPKSKSEVSTSYAMMGSQLQNRQSPVGSLSWWSPGKGGSGSDHDDKGKGSGSPVDGMVQPGALVTLPPPREVARPEMQRNSVLVGPLDEEEWVTVYGFSPMDTNLVLREFEKCGIILKHVPGPRDANWMNILYQSHPNAKGLRNKSFPHYDELSLVFGKDRANGEGVESPADAVEEITNDEEDSPEQQFEKQKENSEDEVSPKINVQSTDTNSRGSKRPKTDSLEIVKELTFGLQKISKVMENGNENIAKLTSCFQHESDVAKKRLLVNSELMKVSGLKEEEIIKAGRKIVLDPLETDYFFSLPEDFRYTYVHTLLLPDS